MLLKDKVVIVTGASRGIGRQIARILARRGARVVFAARTLGPMQEEVARAARDGGEAMALGLDVTSDSSVASGVAAVLARFGRIDVLINNAGNGGTLSAWAASDSGATRDTFDVHVLGTDRMTRAVLPALRQTRGTVVNFASTVGWVPMPGAAAYSAAKAAVISLSEVMRTELAPEGVDVRVFAPPHTKTEAGEAWPLPLPKIFEPEWVADALLHFLEGRRARALPGGNGALLVLQRLWPRLAARIMNGIGFKALAQVQLQQLQAINRGVSQPT